MSALAYQQLLLMALEQQNWPSAASFALLLCEAIATEAAVDLAIALLGARRSQKRQQKHASWCVSASTACAQDNPLLAEMAEPSWYHSSSTCAGGQQTLSGDVVHVVTHLVEIVRLRRFWSILI